MPNEKSSSSVSSNRFFCESVSTLYASPLVSAGPSGGRSSVCSLPCTRICGGVCVVMCRSDPFTSTSVCNSSGNVAMCQLPAPGCQLPAAQSTIGNQQLLHRLPCDFLDRRD